MKRARKSIASFEELMIIGVHSMVINKKTIFNDRNHCDIIESPRSYMKREISTHGRLKNDASLLSKRSKEIQRSQ